MKLKDDQRMRNMKDKLDELKTQRAVLTNKLKESKDTLTRQYGLNTDKQITVRAGQINEEIAVYKRDLLSLYSEAEKLLGEISS